MSPRALIKKIVRGVLWLLVLPAGLCARVVSRQLGSPEAFDFFATLFAGLPGVLGRFVRVAYYHQSLAHCDLSAQFAYGSVVTKDTARIGAEVYVGLYSSVGFADIGENTVLANYVSILSGGRQHNFTDPDTPIFAGNDVFSEIKIGTNTFFGDKATVMADVGSASIIGAGAVVVSAIPDYAVAVGIPAKVVKDRRPRPVDPDGEASG